MAILIAKTPVWLAGAQLRSDRYLWTVYEDCDPSSESAGREVTRQEAKALIRECGLVKVFSNEDGTIYETPDRPVFNDFVGIFYRKAQKAKIDREHHEAEVHAKRMVNVAKANAVRLGRPRKAKPAKRLTKKEIILRADGIAEALQIAK